jgi:hypothetical protein
MAGRLAMKTYLATIGSAKVGFTQTSSGDYIGGVRGLVERNTMRYYLAIDAYLGSLAIPADKRVDQRFAAWFDATEQYPRQLHELDRQAYLQMKKTSARKRRNRSLPGAAAQNSLDAAISASLFWTASTKIVATRLMCR